MDERHQRPVRAGPRFGVDQPYVPRGQLRQRRAQVRHAQRDVVQARSATGQEAGNRRVRRRGFEQFQRCRAGVEHVRPDALRRHLLRALHVETERVAVEGQRLVEALHRNADVIEDGFHAPPVAAAARATSACAAV